MFLLDNMLLYLYKEIDMESLTEREMTVFYYIVKGFSNGEIAQELNISYHTAKSHVSAIYRKLSAKNRAELAYWAGKNNLF